MYRYFQFLVVTSGYCGNRGSSPLNKHNIGAYLLCINATKKIIPTCCLHASVSIINLTGIQDITVLYR